MVARTKRNLPAIFPKRIDPEFTYAYDQGDLLQINGASEVINRWKLTEAPPDIIIDAIAAYDFEDQVPPHLVTEEQRFYHLLDLIGFTLKQKYPKTRRPTHRIVRKISESAERAICDALMKSRALIDEQEFVDRLGMKTELIAEALRLLFQTYQVMTPQDRKAHDRSRWSQWIQQNLFSTRSALL